MLKIDVILSKLTEISKIRFSRKILFYSVEGSFFDLLGRLIAHRDPLDE